MGSKKFSLHLCNYFYSKNNRTTMSNVFLKVHQAWLWNFNISVNDVASTENNRFIRVVLRNDSLAY